MKILWLAHRDTRHPQAGGAERTIHEIGGRLAQRGHTVEVLTGGWSSLVDKEAQGNLHIHRYRGRFLPHIFLPVFLGENRDSDVIVDDLGHAAPWFSPWFSRTPCIVFFRHLHARTLQGQVGFPLGPFLKIMESNYSRIYPSSPFVTESGTSMADLLSLGIAESRIYRIPPGVDTSLFKPGKLSDKPRIAYFGGLRKYKQPTHAIRLMKSLGSKGIDAELMVMGDGPELETMKQLAQDLGVKDKVRFMGRIEREELAQVVGSSWVSIHASVSEGWCYSAMEAAACGVPTVGYRIPGLVEAVDDGKTGILVDLNDLEGLSSAVVKVISGVDSWRAICRAHANKFTWENTTSSWETLMKSQSNESSRNR
jgi:glycosyltransferase involved in cell wall biosynthesis